MANKKKTKEKTGTILRKRKYNKDIPKMLIDHMAQGLSMSSFCAVVDIHKSTLYEWIEKFPEMAEARDIGLNKSRLKWEKMGIFLADGTLRGSAKVWELNMFNRFHDEWKRDRTEKEENDNEIKISLQYDPRKKED